MENLSRKTAQILVLPLMFLVPISTLHVIHMEHIKLSKPNIFMRQSTNFTQPKVSWLNEVWPPHVQWWTHGPRILQIFVDLSCQHVLRLCFLDCHWEWILENLYSIVGSSLPTCKKEKKKLCFNSVNSYRIICWILSLEKSRLEHLPINHVILATFIILF